MRKKYRPYTARKLKLPRRLLFFVIIALAVFTLTVIVGNILKARVDKTDITPLDSSYEEPTPKETTSIVTSAHPEALCDVCAGYFDITGITDFSGVQNAVNTVSAAKYNALSFVVTDENGNLTYASPAVASVSRLTPSASLLSFELVKSMADVAKAKDLRLSAVFTKSSSLSIDAEVIGELYSAGFSEFIIMGFESVEPTDTSVSVINEYLESFRMKAEDADFSVCLSPDIYTNSKNAPFIEKLFTKTEFLSIDLRNSSEDDIKELVSSISGSFNTYMLRCILHGKDKSAAQSVADILTEAGIKTRQYISAPPKATEKKTDEKQSAED